MGIYDRKFIPIMIAIIIFAFAGGSWYSSKMHDKNNNQDELIIFNQDVEINNETEDIEPKYIVVFVNGAVVNPGIYKLVSGARIYEAIEEAGGLLPDADSKLIPMARIIEDEETIYIPVVGEETDLIEANTNNVTSSSLSSKVNINKANASELATLNGIGPALSERIIDYRNSNGPYKDISEIKNVSGIGEKKYEAIKDYISVK